MFICILLDNTLNILRVSYMHFIDKHLKWSIEHAQLAIILWKYEFSN